MSASKIRTVLVFTVLFFIAITGQSQKIASFEVELIKPTYGLDIPVSVVLNDVTFVSDTLLALYEVNGNKRTIVPFQVENGSYRTLHWIVKTGNESGSSHLFELVKSKTKQPENVRAIINNGALTVRSGESNLLQYYFKTVYPPAGVDTVYKRSGFIHPLWAPHGQELTRIQPPDHYHHYGIWNPWTHVLYERDTIDFWNINLKQGTVRFAKFISVENGAVFSEYNVLHEHVVLKKESTGKVAINELLSVRVYLLQKDPDSYFVDFNIQLNCAGENPVKLLEYRYAGLGWRTTEKWTNKNSEVLTSEGKTRRDADGSKARWCIVQGNIDTDYAGIVMMSYPTNYNYPEPLRIWPETQNGRGDMFANFCPTKDMDWLLIPGKNYNLRYRFLVFNNPQSAEKAESAWYYFANPPKVTIR